MNIHKYALLNLLALVLVAYVLRNGFVDNVEAQAALIFFLTAIAAGGVIFSGPSVVHGGRASVMEALLKTFLKGLSIVYLFAAVLIALGVGK